MLLLGIIWECYPQLIAECFFEAILVIWEYVIMALNEAKKWHS